VELRETDVPHGWMLGGSRATEYELNLDPTAVRGGHATVCLHDKNGNVDGFGTLMQQIQAAQYLGKRVRLSGYVKSEDVKSWAGLWTRVDKGNSVVALDNMQNRGIKGTADWQQYAVVLDVPNDATGIAFRILLNGPGRVWLNGTKLEVVGTDVPVTSSGSMERPTAPVNLDFNE
jgi:hypothetical protein